MGTYTLKWYKFSKMHNFCKYIGFFFTLLALVALMISCKSGCGCF